MALPTVPLPTQTVKLSNGTQLEIRALSRSEALVLAVDMDGKYEEAEIYMLVKATGADEDDVRVWRDATPSPDVDTAIAAIGTLSGLRIGKDGKDPQS